MMVSTTLKALVVSFSLPFIVAFQIPTKSTCNRQLTECQAFSTGDRRSFIAFGSSIAGLAISLPANADVADGNALPDGAAKFKRLLQLKNDLGVSVAIFCSLDQSPSNHLTVGSDKISSL